MTCSFTPPAPLNTAVLFIVFNRPNVTLQVFEAIRQARPPRLYVAADGSRADRPEEDDMVSKVRAIAIDVDWPCEVKTLFNDKNLGCKHACSNAVTWFFEQEEQGIILEDDCLPSQSFFWFCENLLTRYKKNYDIWHISGATVHKNTNLHESYHFSAYPGMWGWATWANRWCPFDVTLESFSEDPIKKIDSKYIISKQYWSNIFYKTKLGKIDTWDYQWIFKIWANQGICITPNLNMISNIGFGEDATHTKNAQSRLACMPKEDIKEIFHPSILAINFKLDKHLMERHFYATSLLKKLVIKIKKLVMRV